MNEIIETEATDVTEATLKKLGGEIVALTRQAQKVALVYICEIGERLAEAKELVGHGNWGDWLREECDYSQGTAENYIRIFREFGQRQISFFETDNSKFQNLTYTKLLALTTLTADERERLADGNDLEGMSVRELTAAVEKEKAARKNAESEADKLKNQLAAQREKAKAKADKVKELEEKLVAAERQQSLAEDNAETARQEARAALEAEIAAANEAKTKAEDELRQVEERFKKAAEEEGAKIEAARVEAEKAAAREADKIIDERTANIRKELESVKAKLDAAQKGTVHKAQFLLENITAEIQALAGVLKEMDNPETAAKLRSAIGAEIRSELGVGGF